jgi:hypothetical protein
VEAASAGHSLAGSCPAAIAVQVPTAPGRLQAKQLWPQAEPQQTPSTQNPLAHWTAAVQVAPPVSFARQVFVSQKNPARQSVGPAQFAPHAPSLQTPGAQLFVAPGWQIPSPSQVLAARSVASMQLLAAQTVPARWRRQPPLPSQAPSRPQISGGSGLQSFAGSSPAAIGVQVPANPATLQAWQRGVAGAVAANAVGADPGLAVSPRKAARSVRQKRRLRGRVHWCVHVGVGVQFWHRVRFGVRRTIPLRRAVPLRRTVREIERHGLVSPDVGGRQGVFGVSELGRLRQIDTPGCQQHKGEPKTPPHSQTL